jgi:hypothetical protein
LGDWFPDLLLLSSKASPNDSGIVIIIVIVVGEAILVQHDCGLYITNGESRSVVGKSI